MELPVTSSAHGVERQVRRRKPPEQSDRRSSRSRTSRKQRSPNSPSTGGHFPAARISARVRRSFPIGRLSRPTSATRQPGSAVRGKRVPLRIRSPGSSPPGCWPSTPGSSGQSRLRPGRPSSATAAAIPHRGTGSADPQPGRRRAESRRGGIAEKRAHGPLRGRPRSERYLNLVSSAVSSQRYSAGPSVVGRSRVRDP